MTNAVANLMPMIERIALCFFAGAIPFAVIFMAGSGIDIRKVGSGNPGFNNVLRVSKGRAMLTLIGDMGKGYAAIWFATSVWTIHHAPLSPVALGWIFGFAAVLGHCYSPFLRFNGGKGVATSGGLMLALYLSWAAVALAFFAAMRVIGSKRKWPEAGTLASISTWVLFTLLLWNRGGAESALFATLMTLFLAWRHKSNFARLFSRKPSH